MVVMAGKIFEMTETVNRQITRTRKYDALGTEPPEWQNIHYLADEIVSAGLPPSVARRARTELDAARRAGDLTRMAELQYGRIPELEKRLAASGDTGGARPRLLRNKVTEEEIAEVLSRWTGIPVAKMMEGEREKLEMCRRNYYDMSANLDWNLGRLIDAVDKAGRAGLLPEGVQGVVAFCQLRKQPCGRSFDNHPHLVSIFFHIEGVEQDMDKTDRISVENEKRYLCHPFFLSVPESSAWVKRNGLSLPTAPSAHPQAAQPRFIKLRSDFIPSKCSLPGSA